MKNGQYYIGSCRDLNIRLNQHKNGFVKSTKWNLSLIIIYAKKYKTYSDARIEEGRIKKWKKRRSIENLVKFDKENLINNFGSIV